MNFESNESEETMIKKINEDENYAICAIYHIFHVKNALLCKCLLESKVKLDLRELSAVIKHTDINDEIIEAIDKRIEKLVNEGNNIDDMLINEDNDVRIDQVLIKRGAKFKSKHNFSNNRFIVILNLFIKYGCEEDIFSLLFEYLCYIKLETLRYLTDVRCYNLPIKEVKIKTYMMNNRVIENLTYMKDYFDNFDDFIEINREGYFKTLTRFDKEIERLL